MRKSIEHKIRIKALLIYAVVAVICGGIVLYIYNLWQNIDSQRNHIEQHYNMIAQTNKLVSLINQTQAEANLYIASNDTLHLLRFKRNTSEIGALINTINANILNTEQSAILQDVGKLLREKEYIISSLSEQFERRNPLDSMNQKLRYYSTSMLSDSALITTTIKDTTIHTAQAPGFWKRLANVFSPPKSSDTLVKVSTTLADTLRLNPDSRLKIINEMSVIAEKEYQLYTERMNSLERQVGKLLLTDVAISTQINDLTDELNHQIFNATLDEIQKNERLLRRNYTFSLIGSAISLGLILLFILLIIKDVNRGKAARKALEKANEQIKQIMESRHQLLLSVSHDIKTPLSSILGYLELWSKEDTPHLKRIDSMQNAGKHILALLDNLLEFSSLEQGELQVSDTNFNLWNLCREIADMFEPQALHKQLSFECDFRIDRNLAIYTDNLKVKQIVINILSNAIKYTVEGKVKFTVTYDENKVHFVISDTGAGIPQEEMHRLFKPFARVESNNKLAGGSGLGMYVVKGLVDLLNGTITVDSTVGEGTSIKVEIPVGLETGNAAGEFTSKKILLIDDDLTILTMLRDMLLKLGHSPVICSIPREVKQFLTKDCNYDLIITDMEMGAVSGKDMLYKIRNAGIEVPVIAMSGSRDFHGAKTGENKFDGYLEKPVSMNALCQLLGSPANAVNETSLLEEMFEDDIDSIRDILEIFIHGTQENIALLKKAIANDEFKEAQALCHKMLPMFLQIGAEHLSATLKKMDTLRDTGADSFPAWKEAMDNFIRETGVLITTIRKKYFPD